MNRFLYKEFRQDIETKDSVYDSVNAVPDAVPPVPAGGSAQDINISNVTINPTQLTPGIPLPPGLLDIANWGWSQTCAFSSSNLNTVIWGAGVFKSSSGTTYNISAGTTGVMAAKTYIYFDLNVSLTAYQITTTPGTAVGLGKVLVAVAQNTAVASPQPNATFNLNEASQIVGDNILANTINATKMNVGQLSAITADLGSITAGTITGALIRTSTGTTRVEINSSNEILFYDAGEIRTYISNGVINFNRPNGTGCGTIAGWGSNQIGITVGGESFYFDTGAMWTNSVTNLGRTGDRWGNAYFNGDIDTYGDLQADGLADIGGTLDVGDDTTIHGNVSGHSFSISGTAGEDVFSNFLGYDGTTGIVLGFSGGLLIYYAEF